MFDSLAVGEESATSNTPSTAPTIPLRNSGSLFPLTEMIRNVT